MGCCSSKPRQYAESKLNQSSAKANMETASKLSLKTVRRSSNSSIYIFKTVNNGIQIHPSFFCKEGYVALSNCLSRPVEGANQPSTFQRIEQGDDGSVFVALFEGLAGLPFAANFCAERCYEHFQEALRQAFANLPLPPPSASEAAHPPSNNSSRRASHAQQQQLEQLRQTQQKKYDESRIAALEKALHQTFKSLNKAFLAEAESVYTEPARTRRMKLNLADDEVEDKEGWFKSGSFGVMAFIDPKAKTVSVASVGNCAAVLGRREGGFACSKAVAKLLPTPSSRQPGTTCMRFMENENDITQELVAFLTSARVCASGPQVTQPARPSATPLGTLASVNGAHYNSLSQPTSSVSPVRSFDDDTSCCGCFSSSGKKNKGVDRDKEVGVQGASLSLHASALHGSQNRALAGGVGSHGTPSNALDGSYGGTNMHGFPGPGSPFTHVGGFANPSVSIELEPIPGLSLGDVKPRSSVVKGAALPWSSTSADDRRPQRDQAISRGQILARGRAEGLEILQADGDAPCIKTMKEVYGEQDTVPVNDVHKSRLSSSFAASNKGDKTSVACDGQRAEGGATGDFSHHLEDMGAAGGESNRQNKQLQTLSALGFFGARFLAPVSNQGQPVPINFRCKVHVESVSLGPQDESVLLVSSAMLQTMSPIDLALLAHQFDLGQINNMYAALCDAYLKYRNHVESQITELEQQQLDEQLRRQRSCSSSSSQSDEEEGRDGFGTNCSQTRANKLELLRQALATLPAPPAAGQETWATMSTPDTPGRGGLPSASEGKPWSLPRPFNLASVLVSHAYEKSCLAAGGELGSYFASADKATPRTSAPLVRKGACPPPLGGNRTAAQSKRPIHNGDFAAMAISFCWTESPEYSAAAAEALSTSACLVRRLLQVLPPPPGSLMNISPFGNGRTNNLGGGMRRKGYIGGRVTLGSPPSAKGSLAAEPSGGFGPPMGQSGMAFRSSELWALASAVRLYRWELIGMYYKFHAQRRRHLKAQWSHAVRNLLARASELAQQKETAVWKLMGTAVQVKRNGELSRIVAGVTASSPPRKPVRGSFGSPSRLSTREQLRDMQLLGHTRSEVRGTSQEASQPPVSPAPGVKTPEKEKVPVTPSPSRLSRVTETDVFVTLTPQQQPALKHSAVPAGVIGDQGLSNLAAEGEGGFAADEVLFRDEDTGSEEDEASAADGTPESMYAQPQGIKDHEHGRTSDHTAELLASVKPVKNFESVPVPGVNQGPSSVLPLPIPAVSPEIKSAFFSTRLPDDFLPKTLISPAPAVAAQRLRSKGMGDRSERSAAAEGKPNVGGDNRGNHYLSPSVGGVLVRAPNKANPGPMWQQIPGFAPSLGSAPGSSVQAAQASGATVQQQGRDLVRAIHNSAVPAPVPVVAPSDKTGLQTSGWDNSGSPDGGGDGTPEALPLRLGCAETPRQKAVVNTRQVSAESADIYSPAANLGGAYVGEPPPGRPFPAASPESTSLSRLNASVAQRLGLTNLNANNSTSLGSIRANKLVISPGMTAAAGSSLSGRSTPPSVASRGSLMSRSRSRSRAMNSPPLGPDALRDAPRDAAEYGASSDPSLCLASIASSSSSAASSNADLKAEMPTAAVTPIGMSVLIPKEQVGVEKIESRRMKNVVAPTYVIATPGGATLDPVSTKSSAKPPLSLASQFSQAPSLGAVHKGPTTPRYLSASVDSDNSSSMFGGQATVAGDSAMRQSVSSCSSSVNDVHAKVYPMLMTPASAASAVALVKNDTVSVAQPPKSLLQTGSRPIASRGGGINGGSMNRCGKEPNSLHFSGAPAQPPVNINGSHPLGGMVNSGNSSARDPAYVKSRLQGMTRAGNPSGSKSTISAAATSRTPTCSLSPRLAIHKPTEAATPVSVAVTTPPPVTSNVTEAVQARVVLTATPVDMSSGANIGKSTGSAAPRALKPNDIDKGESTKENRKREAAPPSSFFNPPVVSATLPTPAVEPSKVVKDKKSHSGGGSASGGASGSFKAALSFDLDSIDESILEDMARGALQRLMQSNSGSRSGPRSSGSASACRNAAMAGTTGEASKKVSTLKSDPSVVPRSEPSLFTPSSAAAKVALATGSAAASGIVAPAAFKGRSSSRSPSPRPSIAGQSNAANEAIAVAGSSRLQRVAQGSRAASPVAGCNRNKDAPAGAAKSPCRGSSAPVAAAKRTGGGAGQPSGSGGMAQDISSRSLASSTLASASQAAGASGGSFSSPRRGDVAPGGSPNLPLPPPSLRAPSGAAAAKGRSPSPLGSLRAWPSGA